MVTFDGATAFITGGAQGIGLGIARALAAKGVKLALADVNEAALTTAQAELKAVTETEIYPLDVRDRDAFAMTADKAEAALGPVTLLFNNAGVATGVRAKQMTYQMWDWMLGINLNGVVNGIQTFVPRMIERESGGYIVNTASGAGLVVAGSGFYYTTSKFAVVGMSESLHNELDFYNIGVSVLCPGAVATGILSNTSNLLSDVTEVPTSARASSALKSSEAFLAMGTPIDSVGHMVIEAMQENRLHILTDDVLREAVEARSRAIVDAMPARV